MHDEVKQSTHHGGGSLTKRKQTERKLIGNGKENSLNKDDHEITCC